MPKLTKRLTDTVAKSCEPPADAYVIFWCAQTPGFGVRVMHNGKRAWVTERRHDGKTIRRTLGRVPGSGGRNAITADTARTLALQISNELAQGRDGLAERREAEKYERRSGITFADALRAYVEDNATRKRPLAPRTRADYLGMIRAAGEGENGYLRVAGELAAIAGKRLDALVNIATCAGLSVRLLVKKAA